MKLLTNTVELNLSMTSPDEITDVMVILMLVPTDCRPLRRIYCFGFGKVWFKMGVPIVYSGKFSDAAKLDLIAAIKTPEDVRVPKDSPDK